MAIRPILNPTLRLTMDPTPVPGRGRSKGTASIKTDRLDRQRETLAAELRRVPESPARISRAAGRTLVVARMFSDSLAPSYTPRDLLGPESCEFVAPLRAGYLIDVSDAAFERLAQSASLSTNAAVMTDISRVHHIRPYGPRAILRGRSIEDLWSKGLDNGAGDKLFTAWLMPFGVEAARAEILERFEAIAQAGDLIEATSGRTEVASLAGTSIGRAIREYRASDGVGRAVVAVRDIGRLGQLVASGTVFRIDPIQKVSVTVTPAAATLRPVAVNGTGPVVACVDGGMTDVRYTAAEAWRLPPLVDDANADHNHGNAIASLIAGGANLNPSLSLPDLACRFGVVQAVPHAGSTANLLPDDLYDLLARVAARHRDCRVWNLSFNLSERSESADQMSDFGHQISVIARAGEILPVISIGNQSSTNSLLLPPGDAEAGLTVGGRTAKSNGNVGDHCGSCCTGPGPEGALKPDMSWYSPVTVGNGASVQGSSFAAALTSSLAAHTFEQLRDPTPDLVKALLISRTERAEHDPGLGWGSPFHGVAPWECEPGAVSMVWNAYLEPGYDYYWRDIPIPAELIRVGRIVGAGSLTAVLEPLTSPFAGPNYFASRVEVALQYQNAAGNWANLLGSMKESTIEEEVARSDLKKWQPVRHHKKDGFSHGILENGFLRVRARLYTRDLYQAGLRIGGVIPPQRVAFVLSLRGDDADDALYNSMVRNLGVYVSSAVIEQNVEIET